MSSQKSEGKLHNSKFLKQSEKQTDSEEIGVIKTRLRNKNIIDYFGNGQNKGQDLKKQDKQENNLESQDEEYQIESRLRKRVKKEKLTDQKKQVEDVQNKNIENEEFSNEELQSNESFSNSDNEDENINYNKTKKLDFLKKNKNGDNNDFSKNKVIDKLPKSLIELKSLLKKSNQKLKQYKVQYFKEQYEWKFKDSTISNLSVPVYADITNYDWNKLVNAQLKYGNGRLFDVIMMDPPWQLSSSQPSRGVAIGYGSLADNFINDIPMKMLQQNGFIFLWVINAKYKIAAKMLQYWGYKLVDEITWIKTTVNGKIAKGHGFYLQHSKESCIIGVKGNVEGFAKRNVASDVIISQRRGQSQKPEEIYQYAEMLVPNGYYLEIFGRRNNIRPKWVTLGNEI